MTPAERNEWIERVANVTAVDFPFASGLHAAAQESSSPRVTQSLEALAAAVERGASFEQALQQTSHLLPAHLEGLLLAAARTGELGPVLIDLVQQQQSRRTLKDRIRERLAYPVVVGIASAILLIVLLFVVTRRFERTMVEFQIELPFQTRFLFWWRDVGIWLLFGIAILAALAAIGYRVVNGAAAWQRLMISVPYIGPMIHWLNLAEWLRLLSVLVRHQIPLAESLRLAAAGTPIACLTEFSTVLAEGVARGEPLASALAARPESPVSLTPLIAWGDKSNALSDALTLSAEMLEDRVDRRSLLLQSILPSFIFIAVGCGALLMAGGLFVPLYTFLRALS